MKITTVTGGVAILIITYAVPLMLNALQLRMAIEILYFGLFAVSLSLLLGYGGLPTFGHNATFGVGGYAIGLVLIHIPGIPLFGALALAVIIGALVGFLIGFFCVRLRGAAMALLTLAFSQFLFAIAVKWRSVTKGDDGLIMPVPDITVPWVGTLNMGQPQDFYWVALTVVLICLWAGWRFTRTPLGKAVVFMRENDQRASFLGYNVFRTQLILFTFATALAAGAGALFAIFQGFISPTTLDLALGAEVVFMTVLGGTDAFLGPFLGAGVYLLLQNWLAKTTEHWPFFIGLMFVLLILFAHTGLVGLFDEIGALRWRIASHRKKVKE